MTRANKIILISIIILFGLTLWAIWPNSALSGLFNRDGMRLGLDLQGGVSLVYQADFSENSTVSDQQAAMERAILTIEKRIDKFGVTEPVVQQLGSDRIMVQLPGFTDINAAKSLVEQTGFLEFRETELNTQGQPVYLRDYLAQTQPQFIDASETGTRIFVTGTTDIQNQSVFTTVALLTNVEGVVKLTDAAGNPADNTTLAQYGGTISWIPARGTDGRELTGDLLDDAQAIMDTSTAVPQPAVSIKWNSEGSVIFDQVAARLYAAGYGTPQNALGIFLDNTLLSAPQIKEPQYQGVGLISGSFNLSESQELANLLKSGSLPMPLKKPPLLQEKVSATLGAEFIDLSWKAGLIGLLLVIVFMTAYYRLPGFVSSLALIFYATLTLTICKLWPITLSLGSIGGIVVSMGVAVDANVLIFERMKEEFRAGRTLGAAIEAGFHRAWSAIWDSNMTTFIACIILFWLGSTATHNAAVIGFAVTLFIGAIVSMFTAVLVTRTLLRFIASTGLASKTSLFTVTGGKK